MTKDLEMAVMLAGPSVATAARTENWVTFRPLGLRIPSKNCVTARAEPRRFRQTHPPVSSRISAKFFCEEDIKCVYAQLKDNESILQSTLNLDLSVCSKVAPN